MDRSTMYGDEAFYNGYLPLSTTYEAAAAAALVLIIYWCVLKKHAL